jgi:flagellar biosynthetic protein FlhB
LADEQDGSERTEDPTEKRIDEAYKRGDVPKSQEVNTWFVMAGATLALALFAPGSTEALMLAMRGVLANAGQLPADGSVLRGIVLALSLAVAGALALPLLILSVSALFGNLIQHRSVFSLEGITPKLSRVSPAAGFKRLFSKQSIALFVKGLVKLGIVGAVLSAVVWPERERLAQLAAGDFAAIGSVFSAMLMKVLLATVIVLAFVALADYLWQRHEWLQRQRMSVRDIREEFKQSEGDPQIKGRIRQIRMERARRRMMAEVPKATVVITNPTHYAVALRYEKGMPAPRCLAKGVDALALRIRSVAEEAGVPVIENPPLARALFAAVEVDREIPLEHYKAVAELIGFVWRRKGRRG